MDANGLRFWLLANEDDWSLPPAGLSFDRERRSLRLSSSRQLPEADPVTDGLREAIAIRSREVTPIAIDAQGTRARYDPATGRILSTGALEGEVEIGLATGATDLAVGFDGVLYVAAMAGAVELIDLRGRWPRQTIQTPGFVAWRLAPARPHGVWVLDRDNQRVARLSGQPIADRLFDGDIFRPCQENPNPVTLRVAASGAAFPVTAIASNAEGQAAILTRDGRVTRFHLLDADGIPDAGSILQGIHAAFSLAWVDSERVAVLDTVFEHEAPVFAVSPGAAALTAVGEVYPLRDHMPANPVATGRAPFAHTVEGPPRYPTVGGDPPVPPLLPLSFHAYAGQATAEASRVLDSGRFGAVWHRLYIEAHVPPGTSVEVAVAASDLPDAFPPEASRHVFGAAGVGTPGCWVPLASEIPFAPSWLHCPAERDRAGLFTALLQRENGGNRSIAGRFLRVKLTLRGDTRATPEVVAVRLWGPRFSYAERYLPELYRETLVPDPADTSPTASPADFLERFLGLFESILTPLEDRVGAAHLLTSPATCPAEALDWLASWVGASFDSALDPERRRVWLAHIRELCEWRGTRRGLELALELATGGGVTGGEIVLLEQYRLRRTFATILGADLAPDDDPLLGGLAISGNSFVGDTLFLGDENRREFLSLFSADLPLNDADEKAVAAFFDNFAHRAVVLVHQEIDPQDLGLIRRVVRGWSPAHVETTVRAARAAFVTGLSSLVGVDSYLANRPAPLAFRIDRSRLGRGHLLNRVPSLDPRLLRREDGR